MIHFLEHEGILLSPTLVDIRSIAELYCEIWKEPPWEEYFWTVKMVRDQLLDDSKKFGFRFVVGVDDDVVVGFAIGHQATKEEMKSISSNALSEECFYISDFGVSKDHRKKGIGTELLNRLLEPIEGTIYLRTHQDSKARGVYRENGFRDTGVRDGKYPERTYWIAQRFPERMLRGH